MKVMRCGSPHQVGTDDIPLSASKMVKSFTLFGRVMSATASAGVVEGYRFLSFDRSTTHMHIFCRSSSLVPRQWVRTSPMALLREL